MSTPTTVPLLEWGARPKRLKCGACGAESLCGFADLQQTVFYCAQCYDDGTPDCYTGPLPYPRRKPYFKTGAPGPHSKRDPRSFFTFTRQVPPP